MKVKVLGCSGGIGGKSRRTSSLLVDSDVLIDAGTGVGDLALASLARIDHVFLTHGHLDHIACLPLLLDSVQGLRRNSGPVTVHALASTIAALRTHIFNGLIWPDFSSIPSPQTPLLRFAPLQVGEVVTLGERRITALPAQHTVPAVGYCLDSGRACLALTGDTTTQEDFWTVVNRMNTLRYLIIETAFSESEQVLARASRHLSPALLAAELKKLSRPAEVYITHLKPGEGPRTLREIAEFTHDVGVSALRQNQVFEF